MISRKTFTEIINLLEESHRRTTKISNSITKTLSENSSNRDFSIDEYTVRSLFSDDFLFEGIIKNLESEFGIQDMPYNDINYYIYELDFGKLYKPGMAVDSNGNIIPMSNAGELYDSLVSGE